MLDPGRRVWHPRSRQPLPLVASNSVPKVPRAPGAEGNGRGQAGELVPPCCAFAGTEAFHAAPSWSGMEGLYAGCHGDDSDAVTMETVAAIHCPSPLEGKAAGCTGGCWRRKPEALDLSRDGQAHRGGPQALVWGVQRDLQGLKTKRLNEKMDLEQVSTDPHTSQKARPRLGRIGCATLP